MVVTLRVRVGWAGGDAVTNSQKEVDEKGGMEARKADEDRGKQIRLAQERCAKGQPLPTDNCAAAVQR